MTNITFIGNCQTVTLCYFFQLLLDESQNNISWVLYGEEFKRRVGKWAEKCKNKILDYNVAIETIKNSDIIIYQEICLEKSFFCNTETIKNLTKNDCKLIKIPSIYIDLNNYQNSIEELKKRETIKKVDVTVSDLIDKFRDKPLMLTINHPTTFLFLEVMKKICLFANINFFSDEQLNKFLQYNNLMGLPKPRR